MRPGPLLLAAVFLTGCVHVEPPQPRTVSYNSADARRLAPMLQTADAGPLRVRSVVYKPAVLPLSGFLRKLSRGELRPALSSVHLDYHASNVDDDALRLLIKRGYVPVFVSVTNAGGAPADARALRLALRDASLNLAPIPNAELPREFESLDPKVLAANTYNFGAVVVGCAVLLGAIAGLVFLAHGQDIWPSDGADTPPGHEQEELFSPVRVHTPVDYNGLLFSPGALAPGETASGLLFFKARGADWTALRLTAAL